MSGIKYSNYQFAQATARRLELLRDLQNVKSQQDVLRNQISRLLKEAGDGLKKTFASDVTKAQKWIDQPQTEPTPLDYGTDNALLTRSLKDKRAEVVEGNRILSTITTAFTDKADALSAKHSKTIVKLQSVFYGSKELFNTWNDQVFSSHCENTLTEFSKLLQAKNFPELDKKATSFSIELNKKAQDINTLEDQHQKRLYLLSALRKVCLDMGFRETGEPEYETPKMRSARIVYNVDTIDRGPISFYLALDGIQTESAIADNYCFEEFEKLSTQLEDKFGVQTQFETKSADQPKKLRHKGEKDEPNSRSIEKSL